MIEQKLSFDCKLTIFSDSLFFFLSVKSIPNFQHQQAVKALTSTGNNFNNFMIIIYGLGSWYGTSYLQITTTKFLLYFLTMNYYFFFIAHHQLLPQRVKGRVNNSILLLAILFNTKKSLGKLGNFTPNYALNWTQFILVKWIFGWSDQFPSIPAGSIDVWLFFLGLFESTNHPCH
jgi:hypothetical protein